MKAIVKFTEYERGWGQRPSGEKEFNSIKEALEYADDYNSKNNRETTVPSFYILAQYAGCRD